MRGKRCRPVANTLLSLFSHNAGEPGNRSRTIRNQATCFHQIFQLDGQTDLACASSPSLGLCGVLRTFQTRIAMPLVVMHPQGGTAWSPGGTFAGNPGPPAAAAPSELAGLLNELGRYAGLAAREPGGTAAPPSASRATSAFAEYQGPSGSSNGLSTHLEAVAFWAQVRRLGAVA